MLLCLCVWTSMAHAVTSLGYLSAQQNPDGSFGKIPTSLATPVQSTAEVLRAFPSGALPPGYGKNHGTGLADAAIAACARAANARLATLNTRHFPMLGDVLRPYDKT